jgi:hypothetical protein
MDPKFVYENDKKDKTKPAKIVQAYGVDFDPPLDESAALALMAKTAVACNEYIQLVIKANAILKEVVNDEDEPNMKGFAESTIRHLLELHKKRTGENIVIVKNSKSMRMDAKALPVCPVTTHQRLVKTNKAHKGGLRRNDLNRTYLVKACEDLVLTELERVKSRQHIAVTPAQLWQHAKTEYPFLLDMWEKAVLPTLVDDGWILYKTDKGGEDVLALLPYGKGVPGFVEEISDKDHPMWARSTE